jgi:hypothetical protein
MESGTKRLESIVGFHIDKVAAAASNDPDMGSSHVLRRPIKSRGSSGWRIWTLTCRLRPKRSRRLEPR